MTVTGRTAYEERPDPDCTLCGGSGWDETFDTDCCECFASQRTPARERLGRRQHLLASIVQGNVELLRDGIRRRPTPRRSSDRVYGHAAAWGEGIMVWVWVHRVPAACLLIGLVLGQCS